MEATVVTQEELKTMQEMTAKFNKAKIELANLEIEKQSLLRYITEKKVEFDGFEKSLLAKYGENLVINIQTGEIKRK